MACVAGRAECDACDRRRAADARGDCRTDAGATDDCGDGWCPGRPAPPDCLGGPPRLAASRARGRTQHACAAQCPDRVDGDAQPGAAGHYCTPRLTRPAVAGERELAASTLSSSVGDHSRRAPRRSAGGGGRQRRVPSTRRGGAADARRGRCDEDFRTAVDRHCDAARVHATPGEPRPAAETHRRAGRLSHRIRICGLAPRRRGSIGIDNAVALWRCGHAHDGVAGVGVRRPADSRCPPAGPRSDHHRRHTRWTAHRPDRGAGGRPQADDGQRCRADRDHCGRRHRASRSAAALHEGVRQR